ncbi:MAG: septal ring lytic transglycosylase RlpA family protein [Polaromonas sp.]|uniref:septal ring lytic transglycosylase RlpA family protein n=1 Tax=Polaromonas sp. TaxID=1869339 RepID=UPI002730E463|nr:septal ring lytic transglycosylase RlpA family protein [Polaromonas sp.]MDP3245734.1 septal ring lytic transglycosylase RlpA family protein [Polaromonas sp.]MDP3757590.1 septal ring lytic transglycosylase RlpA family protein [Polaromonas sp.]
MTQRAAIRQAIAVGLLALLAACTTPAPPSSGRSAPRPVPIAPPAPMPASPEAADTPTDAAPLSIGSFSVLPRPALLADEPAREFERGAASWYGPGFHGRLTASGERYDMNAFTAAHRTLPFGTLVRVHSLVNGRDVDLRITDRGPFSRNRIIDVSRAAAAELGMLGLGFKEVVLLVPESTPAMATAPRSPVKKSRRSAGRTPVPKVR